MMKVGMYTHGAGSGHLMRVNAVYKGFRRRNVPVEFRGPSAPLEVSTHARTRNST